MVLYKRCIMAAPESDAPEESALHLSNPADLKTRARVALCLRSACSNIRWPELACSVCVCLFAKTGCWIGFVIAANGILAHTAAAFNMRCATYLVSYDIACNAAMILWVLLTTSWQPQSTFVGAMGAVGFAFSFTCSDKLPLAACIAHCLVVMGCGFLNVYAWCHECQ